MKNPASNIYTIITCRPQVLSGRDNFANMEPLQEEVSNTTPIDFSSRSLFIDFSQYEMEEGEEHGQHNEDEGEEEEEEEEDEVEDEDEDEESDGDGYDSVEVESGEE